MSNSQKSAGNNIHAPFIFAIYLPSLCTTTLFAMQNLVVPLFLSDLGYSLAEIGLAIGAFAIGIMIGELPSGLLLNRFSSRHMMLFGSMLLGVSFICMIPLQAFWPLIVLRIAAGLGQSMFGLALHEFLTAATENRYRGRVLTWIGGMRRLGRVIGPVLGGLVAGRFGLVNAFWLVGGLGVLAAVAVYWFTPYQKPAGAQIESPIQDFVEVARANWRIISVVSIGAFFMQLIRFAPRTIIPLYAESLGLAYGVIGLIETIGGIFDTALFWTAGLIMDRYGRKYSIVPSMILQSIGLLLIPLSAGFFGLVLANALIGLGNTISSGSMLTLSSDLAPDEGRSSFLGLFRLSSDLAIAVAPSLVGVIGGIFALGASAVVMAGLGLVGAGVFGWLVPETLEKDAGMT